MSFKEFKEILAAAQAVVTIAAVLIGGFWTYNVFIKERRDYPHLNVEQKVLHIDYFENIRIVRVSFVLSNTGNILAQIEKSDIRIQQILPQLPCEPGQPCLSSKVAEAMSSVKSEADCFPWPLLRHRAQNHDPSIDIEPGEKHELDFEFAVPPEVHLIRIYSHFRNEKKTKAGKEIGWDISTYYDLRKNGKGAGR